MTPLARNRLTSALIPVLTVIIVLYGTLSHLQIALTHAEVLVVVAAALGGALVLGVMAAFGWEWLRIGVMALSTILLLDVSMHLPRVFDRLEPAERAVRARDRRRVTDLRRIQTAIEAYAAKTGVLPQPAEYGEAAGRPGFWEGWWDVSSVDGNHNGRPFLDFLVDGGELSTVPVDPINDGGKDGDPTGGHQYVYLAIPAGYDSYDGGMCSAAAGRAMYLLAITDLESEASRPPKDFPGSGCDCLWHSRPNFFQDHFDYVLCGAVGPATAGGGQTSGERSRAVR